MSSKEKVTETLRLKLVEKLGFDNCFDQTCDDSVIALTATQANTGLQIDHVRRKAIIIFNGDKDRHKADEVLNKTSFDYFNKDKYLDVIELNISFSKLRREDDVENFIDEIYTMVFNNDFFTSKSTDAFSSTMPVKCHEILLTTIESNKQHTLFIVGNSESVISKIDNWCSNKDSLRGYGIQSQLRGLTRKKIFPKGSASSFIIDIVSSFNTAIESHLYFQDN